MPGQRRRCDWHWHWRRRKHERQGSGHVHCRCTATRQQDTAPAAIFLCVTCDGDLSFVVAYVFANLTVPLRGEGTFNVFLHYIELLQGFREVSDKFQTCVQRKPACRLLYHIRFCSVLCAVPQLCSVLLQYLNAQDHQAWLTYKAWIPLPSEAGC